MTQPPPQPPDGPVDATPASRPLPPHEHELPREQDEHPVPHRSSPRGMITALVIAGVFLVGFGTVGVGALSPNSRGGNASDHEPAVRPEGRSTIPANNETSSKDPGPTTSTGESTSPPTSAERDPDVRPNPALDDNRINVPGNGAVTTSCELPPFATDTASQSAFYEAALPCLVRMWAPALQAAGVPAATPDVVTSGDDYNSPCGHRTWDQTAMYCPGNNTIYMPARYYAEKENRTKAGVYLGQFAHEFGHAVQTMSGINQAYSAASNKAAGTSTTGLELTRRSELQATCFEGMALAALQNGGVSNDLIRPALTDSRARGDEYNKQPDHGTVATNTAWVDRGFHRNKVAECNTWAAEPSEVD